MDIIPAKNNEVLCPKCNAVLRSSDVFCGKCGNSISAKLECKTCGADLKEGQQFCPSCGQATEIKTGKLLLGKKVLIPVIIVSGVALMLLLFILFIFVFPVKDISLSQNKLSLTPKENVTLTYTITPSYALDKSVVWSSSDEKVAKIVDGKVTAVDAGSCEITLKSSNGKTVSATVKVTVPVERISIKDLGITMGINKDYLLDYEIFPANASDKAVTWSSSDEAIATVSKGKISSKKGGACTITATTANGKTATCEVMVDGIDLEAIYNGLEKPGLGGSIELGIDHSYIEFDTNSLDIDAWLDLDTYHAIEKAFKDLGLPGSLFKEVGEARALDGRMSEEFDGLTVSWSYHPDSGLGLIIKKNYVPPIGDPA